ncbi:hypothetical protein BDA99DRAFT_535695 [Phascolomyces articulosus]|uniref:Heterokaryon incompatibility domain-containing protein n=1 Tax=Phascolomyces articulosus TaxID=60185 RepID=A0AAD5KDV7_9FUNG|nr:hypothetical protein BDA99DRAFT_535695 [Phascolomyces articulosus]
MRGGKRRLLRSLLRLFTCRRGCAIRKQWIRPKDDGYHLIVDGYHMDNRHLWYDQICIAQSDNEMKQREIKPIFHIYGNACYTVPTVPEIHARHPEDFSTLSTQCIVRQNSIFYTSYTPTTPDESPGWVLDFTNQEQAGESEYQALSQAHFPMCSWEYYKFYLLLNISHIMFIKKIEVNYQNSNP